MSYLRQKSDFNLDAAKELISKQIYAPSVHCSYYSCFQLLMYIIQDFFGVDYEAQKRESRRAKQTSHNYVIQYIANELHNLEKEIEVRKTVIRQIKQLKQLRVESDYHDIEIGFERSTKALSYADDIRSYVAANFNL
jgi:uncharacterized protein (UPF0332 family)